MPGIRPSKHLAPGKANLRKEENQMEQTRIRRRHPRKLPTNKKEKNSPTEAEGKDRLRAIVVTEAAWVIWVLRGEWRIEDDGDPTKKPTKPDSENRSIYALNQKLTLDIMASDEKKYKKKAIDGDLSLITWSNVVNSNQTLEKSLKYHRNCGVLVSIGPPGVTHPG
jgi:hypothetical protein